MKFSRGWTSHTTFAATVLLRLATCQVHPSVNVGLQTSFNAAPYLIELLETAALENSTSYFPLLDRIAEGVFVESQTDKELYETFIKVVQQDGHFADPASLSSFKYALALHAAAPRIEAHYQYYRTIIEPQMMAAQDAACPVWVHLDGQQYCSPALERAQQPVDIEESDMELPFDRSLGDTSDVPVSVLYADITQPLFAQFHETVSETARQGKSIYRVRYRPSADAGRPLFVSGYGTELVLKRTDYIVIDDRDAKKDTDDSMSTSKTNTTLDLKPLTTSELTNLGLNAASYVLSSGDPFKTLIDVSANFPKFSSIIAEHKASDNFLQEHHANRELLLPPGYNVMWMNGLQIEQRHLNAYSLLDILKKERSLIKQLKDIGLTSTQAVDILSHDVLTQLLANDEPQRYDWRDEEGNPAIIWMNNIEHDRRYDGWMSSLKILLQRGYPGQLPPVRRNIHNLVVPFDIGVAEDIDLVVSTLQAIVKRTIPVRIGLVPTGSNKNAEAGVRLSYHIIDTYGVATLIKFLENILQSKNGVSALETVFEETVKERQPREGKTALGAADALKSLVVDDRVLASGNYMQRLALRENGDLSVIINGIVLPRDGEKWFDKVSQRLLTDNRNLQLEIYEQRLTEDMNVAESMLSRASTRRNVLVVPSDPKNITILSIADISSEFLDLFQSLPRLAPTDSTLLSDRVHILVVADLAEEPGRALVGAAHEFHQKHPEAEINIVHNQGNGGVLDPIAVKFLQGVATSETSINYETVAALVSASTDDEVSQSDADDRIAELWSKQRSLVQHLNFKNGENALWLNGRIVGPITADFSLEDFETLYEYEKSVRVAPVTTAITGLGLEEKFETPLDLAKVTSIVARSLISDVPQGIYEASPPIRMDRFKQWSSQHSLIHVPSETDPSIQIVTVIDPASEAAQPWIPILKTLSELAGVDVKIFLNPKNTLEDLPIKRFYQQVISSAPLFDVDGSLKTPRASFTEIPKNTLFNLGMVVPPSWLVAPKNSVHDLDNIKLSSVPAGENVDATYELENVLIEGHSRDPNSSAAPRGAQLLLGTEQDKHYTDTIIMANLGYFQFKANPGYWQISLKPGRSSKIFNIDSVGAKGYAPQPGDETKSVALMSFQGATLYPRLSRNPGMEKEDVLETSAAGSAMNYLGKGASFASSALSSLGFKKSAPQNADINIFSVASGHLYERMLNIMMVSVMRHTKHTVKFWFIEQFLSPSFKASLPTLAEHYKFDYEMVTYKWPHWLRGQKEKQREIWGYKILFLDVLFPLNLDKVIFVDADQIVRTDMMELNNVDLQGAPYGFTPMCDSRTEMEGFRFWKQGYWKNYLDGKPYHISALYVVDLKKFRQLAAGDRLRQQYHALSADPGSLSNLDQDLPNHMQHVLPIHSLSQDWLWCETWCSDESLTRAKTIDLCNNPQTKEPKLDRARRQVPEWTEYDDEIALVLRDAKAEQSFIKDGSVQEDEQKVLSNDRDHKKDEL